MDEWIDNMPREYNPHVNNIYKKHFKTSKVQNNYHHTQECNFRKLSSIAQKYSVAPSVIITFHILLKLSCL